MAGVQPVWPPIIKNEQLGLRQDFEDAWKAAIAMCQFEFIKQTCCAFVEDSGAFSARRLRQRKGQSGFTDTAEACDHQVPFVFDPFTREQVLEERFVQTSTGFVVNVLGGGTDKAQARDAHLALKAFCLATCCFAVDQQAQVLGMGQVGGAALRLHLGKGFRHAVEPERFKLIECWMTKHILSSPMEVSRATDIAVCDRGAVRGGLAAQTIQTILQNGMQG